MLSIATLTALGAILSATASAAPMAAAETTQVEFEIVETGGPANATDSDIVKRNIGGVYICTDTEYRGTCGYAVQPLNKCIHLDFPWYKSISSFGPDVGTACNWYSDYNCQSYLVTHIGNPGISNLATWDGGLGNDNIGSFLCYASS